jgi:hypothetical protein
LEESRNDAAETLKARLEIGLSPESQQIRYIKEKIARISAKIEPWKDEAIKLGSSARARRRIAGDF